MSEIYTGTKFTTVFSERTAVATKLTDELSSWCRQLADKGLAPEGGGGFAGNLSIRHGEGFIITASGSNLADMQASDFTHVLETDIEKRCITVTGLKEPSSEAMLHDAIYEYRPDIGAVFHGHDEAIIGLCEDLGLPVTFREQPYGTLTLRSEVIDVLAQSTYIVMRNHGFLAMGETADQAGYEALRQHYAAAAFTRSTSQ